MNGDKLRGVVAVLLALGGHGALVTALTLANPPATMTPSAPVFRVVLLAPPSPPPPVVDQRPAPTTAENLIDALVAESGDEGLPAPPIPKENPASAPPVPSPAEQVVAAAEEALPPEPPKKEIERPPEKAPPPQPVTEKTEPSPDPEPVVEETSVKPEDNAEAKVVEKAPADRPTESSASKTTASEKKIATENSSRALSEFSPASRGGEGQLLPPVSDATYFRNPEPAYPRSARRRQLEGTVLLEVEVDMSGFPEAVRIKESSGHTVLDDAARWAVEEWQFRPAKRNGESVAATVEVPIRFALN